MRTTANGFKPILLLTAVCLLGLGMAAESAAAEPAAEGPTVIVIGQTDEAAAGQRDASSSGELPADPPEEDPSPPPPEEPPPEDPQTEPLAGEVTPAEEIEVDFARPLPQEVLFTGAAAYAVPIAVPPGRQGIQPDLALIYNSYRKNGIAGVGWGVDIGAIERSTRYGVNYAADDYEASQGGQASRLVSRAAEWGPGWFGARIESAYSKYFLNPATGGWEVTTREGRRYFYGSTPASRQENDYGVFKWCLDAVTDPNGNFLTVSYLQDRRRLYPLRIDYGGHTADPAAAPQACSGCPHQVAFYYSERADHIRQLESGAEVVTALRLQRIDTLHLGDMIQRTALSYRYSDANGQSLLTAIEQTGAGGERLAPLTFTWSAGGEISFGTPHTPVIGQTGAFHMVDANADSLVDVVRVDMAADKVYTFLSNGDYTFDGNYLEADVPFAYEEFWPETHTEEINFCDVNGDSYPDLVSTEIVDKVHERVRVHLANGDGTYTSLNQVRYDSNIEFTSIQCADIDGDGLADWIGVHAQQAGPKAFEALIRLSNGDGTYAHLSENPAFEGHPSFSDVNGDGFADAVGTDFVAGFPGITQNILYSRVWYGNGRGAFADSGYFTLAEGPDTADYRGTRFADINGDKIPDLLFSASLVTSTGNPTVLYSHGNGNFIAPRTLSTDPSFRYSKLQSIADVNGDGFGDLAVYNSGSFIIHPAVSYGPVNLMTGVDNGAGTTVSITYGSSADYTNHLMPFLVFPVTQMVVTDAFGSAEAVTRYSYAGGFYDSQEREFLGFETVVRTQPDGSQVATRFHQDPFRMGRGHTVDHSDPAGRLLSRRQSSWQEVPPGNAWGFVRLDSERTDYFDGASVFTRSEFAYDNANGLMTGKIVSGTGAESLTTAYQYRNCGGWLWRMTREELRDAAGQIVRRTDYAHENDTGNLIAETGYLDTGADPTVTMAYDTYGNEVRLTDARGYVTTTEYDTLSHTHPVRITHPTGALRQYPAWDRAVGRPTTVVDENGRTSHYSYDSFGRLTAAAYPDGGGMTRSYADTALPRYVHTTVSTGGQSITRREHRDGMGRSIQSAASGEGGRYVLSRLFYDEMGRMHRQVGPFYNTSAAFRTYPPTGGHYLQTAFDYLGRPVEVEMPSGTSGYTRIVTRHAYAGFSTATTDPDGNRTTRTTDHLDRVVRVTEHTAQGDRHTHYAYNAAGDLLNVTDCHGNTFSASYDTLGRKTHMVDPDLGVWSYRYDLNGNLARVENLKNTAGVLADAEDVGIAYTHDEMNRVLSKTVTVPGLAAPQTLSYGYDIAGRVTRITHPDGSYVAYTYHPGTELVGTASGDFGTYAAVSGYTPSGKIGQVAFGNGLVTTYTYDEKSTRLTGIATTGGLQDLAYTYTPAGDIAAIDNLAEGVSYAYTYDDRHRLVEETASDGTAPLEYTYDAVGNILSRTVAGPAMHYSYDNPAHVHAVSRIAFNGTSYDFVYDALGNLVQGPDLWDVIGSRSLTYTAENMASLIVFDNGGYRGTSRITYDGDNRRLKSHIELDITGTGHRTYYFYYIGKEYEFIDAGTWDSAVEHIFAGNLRVATVTRGNVYYFHKDHLGSTRVMSDAAGTVIETADHYPYGTFRDHTGPLVTFYAFTDQELDYWLDIYNYDARLYDPAIGRFLSADSLIPDWYDPQALNRYAYAKNNPLKYTDPQGHSFWDAVDAVSFAHSFLQFVRNPTWSNFGWLAADTVGLVPGLPGYTTARRGFELVGQVIDAARNSDTAKEGSDFISKCSHGYSKNAKVNTSQNYLPMNHPFSRGASHITTSSSLARFPGSKTFGGRDGLFVAPKEQIDDLLSRISSRDEIELALGLEEGALKGGDLIRVDIENPFSRNLSLPTNGNQHFRPGLGLTTGAINEGIITSPLKDDYGVTAKIVEGF